MIFLLKMKAVRNYFSSFRQIHVWNQNTWELVGRYRFFESNVVKISSSNYPWTTPNLRRCTFNKVPKTDKSYKETHILSTTGNLKLNVANDDSICIENVDDSKNKYLLKNGKLQSPIFLFTQFHRKPKI